MLRLTSNSLLVAALAMNWIGLVIGSLLKQSKQTDETARSEIAQSAQSAIAKFETLEDVPMEEEKAVPRSVLKKPTAVSQYSVRSLQQRLKGKDESAAGSKLRYNKRMGRTLKGIKYEAQQKATTTTAAPKSVLLKRQEPTPEELQQHDDHEAWHEQKEEQQEEKQQEENSDDPNSWLQTGAEVEWNPMVGKKPKYLLKENDWIEVTVIDKEDDDGVITYGIQKGALRTRVTQEQLRKPVKAKRLAEDQKREEAFWAKRKAKKIDDGFEDVMVPLKAKSGRTCRGEPVRLSADVSEYHEDGDAIDAEDCRYLCQTNSKCRFASHGMFQFHGDDKPVLSCVSFEACDETTGKGFRSWQKMRLTPEKAQKVRISEKMEDEYVAKIKEAEEVSLQRLEADLTPAKEMPSPTPSKTVSVSHKPSNAIFMTARSSALATEDSIMTIPFWRHLLELGAIAVLLGMWRGKMKQSKRRKQAGNYVSGQQDVKDKSALIKLSNWIHRETTPVITIFQRLANPSKISSDMALNSADAATYPPKRVERASADLLAESQKEKQTPMPNYQPSIPDDGVSGDVPVNRSALRAAFHMAGNRRTSDFR